MNEEKISKEEKVEVKTPEEPVKVPIKTVKKISMHKEHYMHRERKMLRHVAGQAIILGLDFATTFTRESIKLAKDIAHALAPVAVNVKENLSISVSKGVEKMRKLGENLESG